MIRTLGLVAAREEAGVVGETVAALRLLVDAVVVVDDGSGDSTGDRARRAGATVLVVPEGIGKGGALEGALARIPSWDRYLLVDGDVGSSALEARPLLDAIGSGWADLAIGVLPRQKAHGGLRITKRAAGAAIRAACGYRALEPLSGQRALTREVMEAVRPLSGGFGVEVGMTIDAVRSGFRVLEVPVDMTHLPTGRTLGGFVHRGRQGAAMLGAAIPRALGLR